MTVEYRQDLTYSPRFLYTTIAKQALIKLGVIGYNETPDDNLLNLTFDQMLDTGIQICESGKLGSFRTRIIEDDQSKLMPWDHAIIDNKNNGPLNVELPIKYFGSDGMQSFTRSLDCIKTSDTLQNKVMYLVFDGTISKWQNINQPIFEYDEVPFSKLDRSAYIDDLCMKLAPYFSLDGSISPMIQAGADRFKLLMSSRNNDRRNDAPDPLFGVPQDPYYNDMTYGREGIGYMYNFTGFY